MLTHEGLRINRTEDNCIPKSNLLRHLPVGKGSLDVLNLYVRETTEKLKLKKYWLGFNFS